MTKEKSIGQRIYERRTQLGLSQQDLADRVGYTSRSAINKIEKGFRGFPSASLLKFAKALQVSPSWLLIESKSELYERVGRCFEESNLTYVEFEKKTGIPKSSLQRYVSGETKKIPVEALEKMAVLFGVSITWLLYGREDQPEDRQLQFNEEELKKEEILEEKSMATKPKEWLTDAEVEAEIEALKDSEYIKLARKEVRLIYKRRQVLYQLRNLEKRGKELASQGYTIDNIGKKMFGGLEDDGEEA